MIGQILPINNEKCYSNFSSTFREVNAPLVHEQSEHAKIEVTLEWTGQKFKTIRNHGLLYSSSIHPSQQDSLLYTQFSRTHSSSISSSIHSIHCETHLSLYLNISMCDLVLKDLLRRI
jgi:hypothetical protein